MNDLFLILLELHRPNHGSDGGEGMESATFGERKGMRVFVGLWSILSAGAILEDDETLCAGDRTNQPLQPQSPTTTPFCRRVRGGYSRFALSVCMERKRPQPFFCFFRICATILLVWYSLSCGVHAQHGKFLEATHFWPCRFILGKAWER